MTRRRLPSIIGALIGIGVVLQVTMGELGLVEGGVALLHAAIGYAGLALAIAYLYLSRPSRIAIAVAGFITLLVAVQVALGTAILLGAATRGLVVSHRFTGMALLFVGLAGGVIVARLRRKAQKTT